MFVRSPEADNGTASSAPRVVDDGGLLADHMAIQN